jgi:signal transduction histidine kinase
VRRWAPRSLGLLGRLLLILLAVLAVEFLASTFLYERANRTQLREEEAHRLSEHLVIAARLVAAQPIPERERLARELTTNRYFIDWVSPDATATLPPEADPVIVDRVVQWEPVLAGRSLRVALEGRGGHSRLVGALRLPDASWLAFRATVPEEAHRDWHPVILSFLPFAALLLVGTLLLRRTLRPMGMLARAAERVGRASGGIRLPEAGPGEVRRVIRAFNAMQARIGQLIADRTQALAAVGHDLRTPLARLQLRSDEIADPTLRRSVEADVNEMAEMVASMLSFLRGADDPEPPVRTDVAVLAATVADDAADRGGDADYVGEPHLEATVRSALLKRALGNLVENALHYGGQARVAVLADGDRLIIRVDDDGPGIPPDRLEEVVQPFARLDPARRRNTGGLGLGLAIVTRAAEAEGGTLRLTNRAEGGLRAELLLPRR